MIKCFECNKKSLIILQCRCGHKFCLKHRCPELHNCTFNYKKIGKEELEKNNPKIQKKKLETI